MTNRLQQTQKGRKGQHAGRRVAHETGTVSTGTLRLSRGGRIAVVTKQGACPKPVSRPPSLANALFEGRSINPKQKRVSRGHQAGKQAGGSVWNGTGSKLTHRSGPRSAGGRDGSGHHGRCRRVRALGRGRAAVGGHTESGLRASRDIGITPTVPGFHCGPCLVLKQTCN